MLRLNGVEVVPLSKVVKEFALKQGNMKEMAVFQQLVYARWAYKELFRRNLWSIRNAVLHVDCRTHTITLPEDCERVVNISVIDHMGKLQPLTCDPSISTVKIDCVKPGCSCTNCRGHGTLCGAVDSVSYTTEDVDIQGTVYVKKTWTRYDGNGAIQRQEEIPTFNTSDSTVTYTTTITTICNVEITDKGCIKATDTNMQLLRTWCGCGNFPDHECGVGFNWLWRSNDLIPQPYNYYGYWNTNAEESNIIHIFRHENALHRLHERNGIYKIILSYQTNGETPGEEILVPEFAVFALQMGIMWQQKLFNPRASSIDKKEAKIEWLASRVLVNKHLNPIRLEVLAKLQTNLRRW